MKEHSATVLKPNKSSICPLSSYESADTSPISPTANQPLKSFYLKKSACCIEVYDSIQKVPDLWDQCLAGNNQFLSKAYLNALETASPKNIKGYYLLYRLEGKVVGLALCQLLSFDAISSLQDHQEFQPKGFWRGVTNRLRSLMARFIRFKVVISGNMLLSGMHGFYFIPEIKSKKAFKLAETGLKKTGKWLRKSEKNLRGIILKDLYESDKANAKHLYNKGYVEVSFQPSMILDLRPDWQQFEDYLGAMTSKYRVRVRRARKKGKGLERKELTLKEIEQVQDTLYSFYKGIAGKAGFNTFTLHPHYLLELKRNLGDEFRLFAYYKEEELVGFNTTIRNAKELEAHFLGFEEASNRNFQLYLNMLYDIIQVGIDTPGIEKIVFARTALEIKSSVGAKAHDLFLLGRHINRQSFQNRLIRIFVKYLEPKLDWTPRHPFKTEN